MIRLSTKKDTFAPQIGFEQMDQLKVKAWGYLIILSIIWGSSYVLIKIGLVDGLGRERLPPEQLGALRMTLASIALIPFMVIAFKRITKKNLLALIISGLAGNALPAFLFAYAETRLSSSITGMLNALVPVFVILLSASIFGFKTTVRQILGIAIGMLGAITIVWNDLTTISFSWDDIFPFCMVLLATICYATSLTVIKYKLADLPSRAITSLAFFFTGPFCIIYLLSTDFMARLTTQENILPGVGAVAILSLIGTALAVLMFNELIKISSAVFASSVTYLIPIVAIFLGLIYGEIITIIQYSGMAILLVGVIIINKKENKH